MTLLKQKFRNNAFMQLTQGRNKTRKIKNAGTAKFWYLMKMFNPHCVAHVAMSVNKHLICIMQCFCKRTQTRQKAVRFCTKKCNPFCLKTEHGTSRIRYWWELGAAEIWCVSVHELNVTIVKSYFDPNKFRSYSNWKHLGKDTNCRRKANLLWENDSPYILKVEMIFYYTALSLSVAYMHFDCFCFFSAFKLKKYQIGLNRFL